MGIKCGIVGLPNVGKSTLFNALTRARVQAEDMLFATLDPTLRMIRLPHGGKAMLSDTVGFISDLPTMLVAVNEEYAKDGDPVPPGATVALIPPVSGG